MTTTRQRLSGCPVEGCPRTRQSGHLMCRPCWRRVTLPTQDQVYKTWRAVRGADTLDGGEYEAYQAAAEQAKREAEA